jgi:hypothetical protein
MQLHNACRHELRLRRRFNRCSSAMQPHDQLRNRLIMLPAALWPPEQAQTCNPLCTASLGCVNVGKCLCEGRPYPTLERHNKQRTHLGVGPRGIPLHEQGHDLAPERGLLPLYAAPADRAVRLQDTQPGCSVTAQLASPARHHPHGHRRGHGAN